jgi:hypothetical protein
MKAGGRSAEQLSAARHRRDILSLLWHRQQIKPARTA